MQDFILSLMSFYQGFIEDSPDSRTSNFVLFGGLYKYLNQK